MPPKKYAFRQRTKVMTKANNKRLTNLKTFLSRKVLVALGIPTIFIPGLVLASILGWNWKHDLKALRNSGGYQQSSVIFPTEAYVTNVLDGDTFEISNGQTVRLVGINSPDRGSPGFQEAKEYLENLIDGEKVRLEYDQYQEDKYGRLLAYVYESCQKSLGCQDGERMINWVLLKKGIAKLALYDDRRKLKYEDLLRSAE